MYQQQQQQQQEKSKLGYSKIIINNNNDTENYICMHKKTYSKSNLHVFFLDLYIWE